MIDLEAAARVAEEAALAGGEVLLAHLGHLDAQAIERKSSGRDLVTQADLESERTVLARLREAFPEVGVEAEEAGVDADAGVLRWIVDPLDGTTNFVHRIPAFCVSIALVHDDEPLVGVVHAPRLSETFRAVRGGGTTLNGTPVAVSDTSELAEALLATGFPYRRSELANDNLDNFAAFYREVRDLRRLGSAALDLAYTAAGRFDGFWELHLAPHDVAAGALLVREAGGVVTDGRGGPDWLRGGHIVAAGEALAGAIRTRLRV